MSKTVVILGAGWAGLPLAHKLLKYTLPKIPSLKVILVSPNSHFFWNVAATRGIIPDAIPDQQLFLPIEPGFEQYSEKNFEFVLGKAYGVHPDLNTVRVICNDSSGREIKYDELVIATGSCLASGLPLKPIGTHQETVSAWKELKGQVGNAKSIVVAGAGATGSEVAGELAARYGSSKDITLIISGDRPLEGALGSVRTSIEKDLKTLGVRLIYKTRVNEAKKAANGQETELLLSTGTILKTDLYLPLHGIKLNTSFVPSSFLDSKGNINLDEKMRVVGTNNIWAIGDVGNIDPKQLTITDNQIIHVATALDAVLTGQTDVKKYEPETKKMLFVALGKNLVLSSTQLIRVEEMSSDILDEHEYAFCRSNKQLITQQLLLNQIYYSLQLLLSHLYERLNYNFETMLSFAKVSAITAFLACSPLATAAPQVKDNSSEASLTTKLNQADSVIDRYKLLPEDKNFLFSFNSTPLGIANSKSVPALTGAGLSLALAEIPGCSMITIHAHPRAAELFAVVSGQVYTEAVPESFVLDSENKPRVIRNEIGAGEATVFYQGTMHYQINTDCDPTVALAAFSSEDAGFTGIAAGLFSVKDDALVNTFGEVIAGEDIDKFREGISKQAGMKVDQCLKKCGKQKRQF
ncbi:hypothetical protein LB507_009555 [Fusarium sp. FIESC RH6]|nr:hypothetical protein LB507_009555 [Fusarium sp. FIESC RH6]